MEFRDNRIKRRRREQAGFTLIELLVVIAILGILAAIVVLNVTNTKSTAQTTACQADTQAVQTAVDGYYFSTNNYPIVGGDAASTSGGQSVNTSELLNPPGANPFLDSSPATGESFTYGNTSGQVQGSVNGSVCQTG